MLLGGVRDDDVAFSYPPVVSLRFSRRRTRMKSPAVVARMTHSGKVPGVVAPAGLGGASVEHGGTHKFEVRLSSCADVGAPRLTHSGKITLPNPAFERTRFSARRALSCAAQRDC